MHHVTEYSPPKRGGRKGIRGDIIHELKVLFQENSYGKPYKKTLKRTENLAITFLLGNWDIAATLSVFRPPDCQSAMH